MTQLKLEENIMNGWATTHILKLLMDNWDSLDEDQKLNMLIGYKDTLDLAFASIMDAFEAYLKEVHGCKKEAACESDKHFSHGPAKNPASKIKAPYQPVEPDPSMASFPWKKM